MPHTTPCKDCGRFIFALRHLMHVATLALHEKNRWASHSTPKGGYLMLPETRAQLKAALETAALALTMEEE